ncbi:FusB/FusC family EF-G-binding protein [Metabacillus idriensis]|uniref:FusB/FusC family EF-G-binding protein n=1 Tax=Metabacillus idriensis TaxID=324768 RepID=UPI00174C9F7D|nr:FusB/FusC family EF-G-binding protein [Metabacillus idriensis]
MQPFIRSDQYHFIKAQTMIIVNGNATVNDSNVLQALKSLAKEKVMNLFIDISDEQEQLLLPIFQIEEKTDAEEFLAQLIPYVIPFKAVSEQTIKKLFPKAKKLKVPSFENLDFKEISYLSWHDKGSNKQYIVVQQHNKLVGLQGTFNPLNKKGICTLCHGHAEVGMFTVEKKGAEQGTLSRKGNYICQDSQACNHNLKTLDRLFDFVVRLGK